MAVLTDTERAAWFNRQDVARGCIIEAGVRPFGAGSDSIRYISSFSYTTNPTDIPANQYYEPIFKGGFKYTEKIDPEGIPSLSIGDIELRNDNGEYDSWLADTWISKSIKVYIGDPLWPRDSFILIFDGVIADIDSKNRNTINLKIRDKLSRLNTPINELNYANIAPYPDSSNVTPYRDATNPTNTIPDVSLCVALGENFNITPVLIDTGNLIYMVNYGPIEGIIEIRDNGVPLEPSCYTVYPSTGLFKMLYRPEGQLTVSLKGDKLSQTWDSFAVGVTYRQTVGSIIRRLVTGYGKSIPDPVTGGPSLNPSPDRFTTSDIDTTNFNTFETLNPTPVGVFSNARDNLLLTCQNLASSIGAQVYCDRLGKLRISKISSPPIGTPRIIDESSIKVGSLYISKRTSVQGAIKLGFCKNNTQQTSLSTRIPNEHKVIFADLWATILVSDGPTITKYNLNNFPTQQNTNLITQPEAYAEATRRLNLYKVPHNVYKFTGYSDLLDLQLGDTVQLVHNRFDLDGSPGVGLGTVVSLQPIWSNGQVEVEVFV